MDKKIPKLTKEQEKLIEAPVTNTKMILDLGYGDYILPVADGLIILDALSRAEEYKDNYNDGIEISPVNEKVKTKQISHDRYRKIKMAKLLGIKLKDLDKNGTT